MDKRDEKILKNHIDRYIIIHYDTYRNKQIHFEDKEDTMSYTSKDIKNIVAEIIEKKKDKGGVKSIYFVGCGGSSALFILQRRSWRRKPYRFAPHG